MELNNHQFETLTGCPVCLSPDIIASKPGTFNAGTISSDTVKITDSGYGKIWNLSRCRNCSFLFANPCPHPSFIHTLYSRIEDPDYEEESDGREKNFFSILKRLEKLNPEKGALFDVGAATGILLHLAAKRGWNTAGIEPSEWAVEIARNKYGIEIEAGTLDSYQAEDSEYQAVTMVDFIEHVSRPREALEKARQLMSDNGTLCLVTPDVSSTAAKIAGKKWWHFRPAHLGYYNRKSLSTLLDATGYKIIQWRRYAWTFSAYYLLTRLPALGFLYKHNNFASFWRRIQLKLALRDSFEIFARKKEPG